MTMILFRTMFGLLCKRISHFPIKGRIILSATYKSRINVKIDVINMHIYSNIRNTYFTDYLIDTKFYSCTSNFLLKNRSIQDSSSSSDIDIKESEGDDLQDDTEYEELSRQWLCVSNMGHQVLVIQPYVKWGGKKKQNTTPELQLAEAVALVHSLPKWRVVEKLTIALQGFERKTFFGSGNLEMLRDKIKKSKMISAVFISTHILRGSQHRELEKSFGVPVYDRYTVVIQIFREHAKTREAKLQVAMAEIPYLWSRLKGMHEGASDRLGGGVSAIGGVGETFIEVRQRLLASRENKIKHALQKLRGQRQLLRNKRIQQEYPTVAVVGYTNSGKTSLIKALTGDQNLQPEDRLFATLDVTTHLGILPCRLKVLYVDTVGFISDIPTNLIESFVATLEDAMLADVILHVRDINHPDTASQTENVMATLQSLHLNATLMQNIVVVGNKVDLIQCPSSTERDWIPVSATKHIGLGVLNKKIEEAVLQSTGRVVLVIRVPMGGEESRWLYKEAAVTNAEADPDNNQYILLTVVISQAQLGKFRHHFIKSRFIKN